MTDDRRIKWCSQAEGIGRIRPLAISKQATEIHNATKLETMLGGVGTQTGNCNPPAISRYRLCRAKLCNAAAGRCVKMDHMEPMKEAAD
jgi:hypothetical protein